MTWEMGGFFKNMNIRLFYISVFTILAIQFASIRPATAALSYPKPTGYVNDFAAILSAEQKAALEERLIQLEKDRSVEFTVVTVKSLEGTTIEDYAVHLFETWQIGKKDKDNGLLFLIAPNERKVRFEVGYGLEPILTDAHTGRILDNYVLPEFKANRYSEGIIAGVTAVLPVLRGENVSDSAASPKKSSPLGFLNEGGFELIFFLGIIFLQYFVSFLARSKSFWAGGVLGALAGSAVGFFIQSLIIGLAAAAGLGLLGFLLDYVLSKNYDKWRKAGLPTTFWGTFGGFGGGRSGGGGGSRSW